MKKYIVDLALYTLVFGIVYYQNSHDTSLVVMLALTAAMIGFATVLESVLGIVVHGAMWFWNATVNYRKGTSQHEMED